MSPTDLVKARLLKGMQDGLPELTLARRVMLRRVEEVCRRFGFLPFDTPALELRDALLGPGPSAEQQRNIFCFSNQDEEEVGLRFDLTVPLARVVSTYTQGEIPRPFRRYAYGPVWRYDKPEPGRYREFLQFDIDSVGTPELTADAEIIAVIDAILSELQVGGYVIRVSNRKLLNAVGEFCGADPQQARSIYRVIDKLDKFPRERIRQELGPGLKDESGAQVEGLGLSVEQIARVDAFLDLPNEGSNAEIIAGARTLLADNALAMEALGEIEQMLAWLKDYGVPGPRSQGRVNFDLHLARGLGYYSGPVFEVVLTELPSYGSIFGGGRYDNLVERFMGEGQGIPAVGASVGVDRLLAALKQLGKLDALLGDETAGPQVLVTVMDRERLGDYIAMTRELREAGIRAEMWQGGKANMQKQMKYADKLGCALAIIAGSDEFERGEVSVKDLQAGKELATQTASREEWTSKEKRPQTVVKRSEMAAGILDLLR